MTLSTLQTSDGGLGDEIATGLLWLGAGASLFLAGLVVHTGYDVVTRLIPSRSRRSRADGSAVEFVVRAVELGLAVVMLAVIGFYGHLVATQPGGEGVGEIAVGVVFIVGAVSVLLAVSVVARGSSDMFSPPVTRSEWVKSECDCTEGICQNHSNWMHDWNRVLQALGGLGIVVSGVLVWYTFQRPLCAMAGGSCSPTSTSCSQRSPSRSQVSLSWTLSTGEGTKTAPSTVA